MQSMFVKEKRHLDVLKDSEIRIPRNVSYLLALIDLYNYL